MWPSFSGYCDHLILSMIILTALRQLAQNILEELTSMIIKGGLIRLCQSRPVRIGMLIWRLLHEENFVLMSMPRQLRLAMLLKGTHMWTVVKKKKNFNGSWNYHTFDRTTLHSLPIAFIVSWFLSAFICKQKYPINISEKE